MVITNDFHMLIFAVVFGGQYNTISQIARLIAAFYLVYVGKNCDLLPKTARNFCTVLSFIYFGIVIAAAITNTVDYLRP